jgi:hypothetical protein
MIGGYSIGSEYSNSALSSLLVMRSMSPLFYKLRRIGLRYTMISPMWSKRIGVRTKLQSSLYVAKFMRICAVSVANCSKRMSLLDRSALFGFGISMLEMRMKSQTDMS